MKSLILIVLSILAVSSCKNDGKKITTDGITYTNYNVREKDTAYLDIRGNKYKHFSNIPDSLRTPEQQKLANAIKDVLINGVVIENNHQVLKFTKEQCLARGLTLHYYEMLKNNIRTNNSFNDAHGVKETNNIKDKNSLDSTLKALK